MQWFPNHLKYPFPRRLKAHRGIPARLVFVHARRGKTAGAALKTTPSAGGIPRCAAGNLLHNNGVDHDHQQTGYAGNSHCEQAEFSRYVRRLRPERHRRNSATQRRQNPAHRAPTPDDFGGYTRKDCPECSPKNPTQPHALWVPAHLRLRNYLATPPRKSEFIMTSPKGRAYRKTSVTNLVGSVTGEPGFKGH